uniref:Uncharacterized protein n=1 Tax=Pristionchus pacificus TaxID=54126 RepID=A0A2A6C4T4_PRIPA|eukprot:PDM73140.1 hypothetical protein PRIPAC_39574 [Pristionchus pacificus]
MMQVSFGLNTMTSLMLLVRSDGHCNRLRIRYFHSNHRSFEIVYYRVDEKEKEGKQMDRTSSL